MEYGDNLEGGGEEMLPRKRSDKRGRSPHMFKGQKKRGKTIKGSALTYQIVECEGGRLVFSDWQGSVNVALR